MTHTPVDERRRFFRFRTALPVELILEHKHQKNVQLLENISEGGVCFRSREKIPAHSSLHITIPWVKPSFTSQASIRWTQKIEDEYLIGAEFLGKRTENHSRMVEQICRIEYYRDMVNAREKKTISSKDAARLFAKQQPAGA